MNTEPDTQETTNPDWSWREELKPYTTSKYQLELLENGPKSLSQSWILQALYCKWKKIKGIREPEPPNCQSSFKDFNIRVVEHYEANYDETS